MIIEAICRNCQNRTDSYWCKILKRKVRKYMACDTFSRKTYLKILR